MSPLNPAHKMVEENLVLSSCFYRREMKGCFEVTQFTTSVHTEVPKTPLMKSEVVSRLWASPAGPLLYFYSRGVLGIVSCQHL